MSTIENYNYCPACGGKLPVAAKYCPSCGKKATGSAPFRILPKHILITIAVTVAVWLPSWFLSKGVVGEKPKEVMADLVESDPDIKKLREAAESAPQNIESQRSYAAALLNKLRDEENPSQRLVLDAIEVLSSILKIDPKDTTALVALADLSFNQQVFDKASTYYTRYLELEPNDNDARARLASSLSFQQNFDEAIKQLSLVLSKDPKNFHASAYLAITYAQMGDKPKAISAGENALGLAPNEEARARFSQFIEAVKGESASPAQQPAAKASVPQQTVKEAKNADSDPVAIATEVMKANQIAAPKFVDARLEGTKLFLTFHDFPMDGMPPFVKDKFVNTLKLKLTSTKVSELIFIDSATGKPMVSSPMK